MRIALSLAFAFAVSMSSAVAVPPVVPGTLGKVDPAFAGRVLLSELNCTSCHEGSISAKGAPDLTGVTGRISRKYLEEFIANPHAAKPGTTMPQIFSNLTEKERSTVSSAIAEYLEEIAEQGLRFDPIDPEAVTRGRDLYHKVGCVACHDPEGKPIPGSSPLHRLEDKYSLASLTAFLEDPLKVRPGGRMPDMNLDHWEAVDIANFLLRDQVQNPPEEARGPRMVSDGKVIFDGVGCAQCHRPGTPKTDLGPGLSELVGSRSCSLVDYDLSDLQQSQIAAALKQLDTKPDPETAIRLEMARLNCIACHTRGDIGGPASERDEYFTTTNLNLGEQARIPPPLTGVGAKLKPAALRKILVQGEHARPYVNTRMPLFGAKNVESLLEWLPQHDKLPPIEFTRVKDEKEAREAGVKLAGDKMLACVACHTHNGEGATTLAGMDLTVMGPRLQENWFHQYMRNPQKFSPSTVMPAFWPGGKPVRPEVLDGDTGKQIDAIWQYLGRGRQSRRPSGIRREPIEYGPADGEAVMLRRQYNGIGKRGIGVGYPSGINLAFDAGQMRLGAIWKGDFAEMSGVWRGQGSGNVGERSREVVRFPVGPAFAKLKSADDDWPVVEKQEKPEGFQFKGYTLDEKQRPTFRYTFDGVAITDRFVDVAEGPSLVRTLTFDPPAPSGLFFRAAADKELAPAREIESAFLLPKGLRIRLSNDSVFRRAEEGLELLIPLSGQKSVTIEYIFSAE